VTAPTHLLGGWYDFMIDQVLADYQRLVAAGQKPFLTISSTTHITGGHDADNPEETLAWMRAHLLGETSRLRPKPVSIEISGGGGWHEFDVFPPGPPHRDTRYLGPDGVLVSAAATAPASSYHYDPADPTPDAGGAIFAFTGAGPVSQQRLEARRDVLVFTSPSLVAPLTIIGNAEAKIFMRARLPHVDLFVRLCDVDASGRSINICDGFLRLGPQTLRTVDGIMAIDIRLHATAHRFREGHRLRLQVSSGAHPRYARNMGTDEPVGEATTLIANDIEIFHDTGRPSAITLPVYDLT
jgi:putative CocE/NonD family hydrolase